MVYAVLLAVLLVGLGLYQYSSLRNSLISARVSSLRGDVAAGRADFLRIPRLQSQVPRRFLCAPSVGAGAVNAARQYASAITVVSGRTVSVVVYGTSLEPVVVPDPPAAGVAPTAAAPRLQPADLRRALGGRETAPEVIDGDGGSLLVVGFPIQLGAGPPCGVAQLSIAMGPIDAVLNDDRNLLLAGGLVALLIAIVAGLWLTGRALRPMHRLTDTAGRLAAGDLGARSRLVPRDDEVGKLALAFDDMADRIEASFAAQVESETRTRRFIADASHELRTPVTGLKGYIDVLRRGAAHNPEALDAALDAMAREAERMRALVVDLLTLARLDAQPASRVEVFELNGAVAALLDEAGPGTPEQVRRRFADAPLMVRADREAVATIVRNLLVNAAKHAPGASQEWSTSRERGWAVLSAEDDGPGIPAADLPHVFERFYRGGKMRAREDGGGGLGLSIVQGLAHAQGGEVALESAEGRGTVIRLRLPLARDQPTVAPEHPDIVGASGRRRSR